MEQMEIGSAVTFFGKDIVWYWELHEEFIHIILLTWFRVVITAIPSFLDLGCIVLQLTAFKKKRFIYIPQATVGS